MPIIISEPEIKVRGVHGGHYHVEIRFPVKDTDVDPPEEHCRAVGFRIDPQKCWMTSKDSMVPLEDLLQEVEFSRSYEDGFRTALEYARDDAARRQLQEKIDTLEVILEGDRIE